MAGVDALSSSRNSAAFAFGAMRLKCGERSHAVLNSLSFDFISVPLALLSEAGAFEEIGKRSIWASERHRSAFPATSYCAVALDTDMSCDPAWMHGVLELLSARADIHALQSLPLESFLLESQYELAFRALQSGLNLGKIVVRLAPRTTGAGCSHIVTGGTTGLGLLTGRWLAQRGAEHLVLASRSGSLAQDMAAEWEAVMASNTRTVFARCDTSEVQHVRRLIAFAPSTVHGLWHAAGALADATLHQQRAAHLAFVYAPKSHGAWNLHAMTWSADLRVCALFSSVAALLGGAGQANYAAANACLDALAACRRPRGTASTSVQWGAWSEVGMASRGAAGVRLAARAAASGFGLIGLAQGLAALGSATRHGAPPVLSMLPMVWSRYLGGGAAVPAFLSRFAAERKVPSMAIGHGTTDAAVGAVVSLEAVLELVKRTAGGSVDADAPLMESGVDSLGATELRNQLQGVAGEAVSLPSTLVFDYPTARQIATTFEPKKAATRIAQLSSHPPREYDTCGTAITGTSVLFPAGVASMPTARCFVASGRVAVSEVPVARWDMLAQPTLPEPVAMRVRHLGYVRDEELMDNGAFAVSPAEAAAMDPCQRLVLERGYDALHESGMDRALLSASLTGFFLGFAGTAFFDVLAASPAGGSVYAATGSSISVAAGRLPYTLASWICVTFDTACSSALVATHAALRSLQMTKCYKPRLWRDSHAVPGSC